MSWSWLWVCVIADDRIQFAFMIAIDSAFSISFRNYYNWANSVEYEANLNIPSCFNQSIFTSTASFIGNGITTLCFINFGGAFGSMNILP